MICWYKTLNRYCFVTYSKKICANWGFSMLLLLTNMSAKNNSSELILHYVNNSVTDFWTFSATYKTLFIVLSVCTNSFVLRLMFHNRRLLTPFNVYIVFLLVANLFYSVIVTPISVLSLVHKNWPYGRPLCNYFQFGSFFGQGLIGAAHLAMILNLVNKKINFR